MRSGYGRFGRSIVVVVTVAIRVSFFVILVAIVVIVAIVASVTVVFGSFGSFGSLGLRFPGV